jgi:hypothetical protein
MKLEDLKLEDLNRDRKSGRLGECDASGMGT